MTRSALRSAGPEVPFSTGYGAARAAAVSTGYRPGAAPAAAFAWPCCRLREQPVATGAAEYGTATATVTAGSIATAGTWGGGRRFYGVTVGLARFLPRVSCTGARTCSAGC